MTRPRALVSAARGIGDILRVTPLVRVCARLGYEVDVLIASDYAGVAGLIEGDADIRRLFHVPSPWRGGSPAASGGVEAERYDVATFTFWSQALRPHVHAARVLAFGQAPWLRDGDTACVRAIAGQLGWTAPLPAPFAHPSARRFDLEAGTVALHPGCKPDWPWKKWHGFHDLAARLPSVVVVGSDTDRCTDGTYFHRPFQWPSHVQDLTGTLDLADTAAVLSQCAALVANDSGLMHLGVALGVPTFGIFGITSPARETMDAPNMTAVTKGLVCEPGCRRGAWGRRNCEHDLRCLRTLTADEVAGRLPMARGADAWTI